MIDNDLSRSFEFISNPIEAGKAAKRYPFSLQTIIGIHVLCAILSVFLLFTLKIVMPLDTPPLNQPANMSQMETRIFLSVKNTFDFLYANPLISGLFNAASRLAILFLTYFVGNKFNPNVGYYESLSALTRFEMMRCAAFAVLQIIAIVFWILSPNAGATFNVFTLMFAFFLLILQIKFIQGVFDLEHFGKALGLMFVVFLCLFGIMFLISLFSVVFMI